MTRYTKRVALSLALLLAGCAGVTTDKPPVQVFPDMKRQPKYKPQQKSTFFSDGQTQRRPVAGTVAIGRLNEDEGFHTGAENGLYVGRNPLPLTMETLKRGQERFNVYCAPCHDRTGSGWGMVGQKSMWLANNLHDARIKEMADGEIYQVLSYGRRSMSGYRFQIAEKDRWAIVAYVRALQRATSGVIEDVPTELRSELR